MRASKRIRRLAVDANPILSALIGGVARRAFLAHSTSIGELATTEQTVREVIEYIPKLAKESRVREAGVTEADLYFALVTAPLTIYEREFYEGKFEQAAR